MSTVQPRVAGADFEFCGKRIKKGDIAFLWVLSANNDPEKFPEPGKLDFKRVNSGDVVTFGPGIHHCVGHYLARVELDIFFRTFLPKFSKIEILEDDPVLSPTLSFRGFAHLNARFTV